MKQEGFLRRVFVTSAAVSVYVAAFLLALGWWQEAASFLIGAVLSIGVFGGTVYLVMTGLSPREHLDSGPFWRRWLQNPKFLVLLALSKWALAGYLIWRAIHWSGLHLGAFLAGAGIVQAVLFLKALGQMVADRSAEGRSAVNRSPEGSRPARPRRGGRPFA